MSRGDPQAIHGSSLASFMGHIPKPPMDRPGRVSRQESGCPSYRTCECHSMQVKKRSAFGACGGRQRQDLLARSEHYSCLCDAPRACSWPSSDDRQIPKSLYFWQVNARRMGVASGCGTPLARECRMTRMCILTNRIVTCVLLPRSRGFSQG